MENEKPNENRTSNLSAGAKFLIQLNGLEAKLGIRYSAIDSNHSGQKKQRCRF
jgi:hypothetical protein